MMGFIRKFLIWAILIPALLLGVLLGLSPPQATRLSTIIRDKINASTLFISGSPFINLVFLFLNCPADRSRRFS